jgi:hypothetical protein
VSALPVAAVADQEAMESKAPTPRRKVQKSQKEVDPGHPIGLDSHDYSMVFFDGGGWREDVMFALFRNVRDRYSEIRKLRQDTPGEETKLRRSFLFAFLAFWR